MKEKKFTSQQEQLEKLEELGARLRQFRTEKSISLEDVAAKTRIQARLLNAIEEGRLDQLPEPIYIKGFIKRFAEAVGMNGAEFSSSFPIGVTLQRIRPTWRYIPVTQLRPIHLYLVYVVLVIGSVNGLSFLVRGSASDRGPDKYAQQNPPIELPTPPKSSNTKSLQKLNTAKPVKLSQQTKDGKSVQVSVRLKADSWMRIVADGETKFEGILPEGTQRSWVANKTLIVRAGDAGNVLVEFNDQTPKEMGEPGKVEEMTFAANTQS
jgi:cytoskeletal protein RodZ